MENCVRQMGFLSLAISQILGVKEGPILLSQAGVYTLSFCPISPPCTPLLLPHRQQRACRDTGFHSHCGV